MDGNITYIRGTRDRVIDQLGFGRTYPLADLPVTVERAIVGFNNEGKIFIDFTQKDVVYQLLDHRTGAEIRTPIPGNGSRLTLPTQVLNGEDYEFAVRATKPRTGLSIVLGATVLIKVGIDNTLPVELPVPEVDWNAAVLVKIVRAQENAKYQLFNQAGEAISAELFRDQSVSEDGNLYIPSYPQKEDTTITVKATNLKTSLFDNLLATVETTIRPNIGQAVSVKGTNISYDTAATIVVANAQASATYNLYLDWVDDDTLDMNVERGKLLGSGTPNADGTFEVVTSALKEDTRITIQAVKENTNITGTLTQTATVAVFPNTNIGVEAVGRGLEDGAERTITLTGTQRGVQYQLFAPGNVAIGWPRFHHKNRGIDQGSVDHDFAIGTFDGGAISLPTWLLKETTTFTIQAKKVANGLVATVATKPKFSRRSLLFDGVDDYITLPTPDVLKIQNASFTVEAWIKPADLAGDRSIVGTDGFTINNGLHLILRGGIPYMGFFNNDIAAAAPLAVNTWFHLAWRYDLELGEQTIFLNGKSVASSRLHAPFQGADPVYIGRWASDRYFSGKICDVCIWSFARSQQHIEDGMNHEILGTEAGLVACWPLHDNKAIADDIGPSAHHGTLTGPTWKT